MLHSRTALASVMLAALLLAPAAIAARARDVTSTAAYLRADFAYIRAMLAALPASRVTLTRFAESFNSECKGVFSGEPMQPLTPGKITGAERRGLAFLEEAFDAESMIAERPALAAEMRFVRAIKRLRWSSRKVTRLVRAQAAQDYAQAHLMAPNLCADAKSWAASGFHKLSASTQAFVKHENAIGALTERLTGPLDYPETFARYLQRLLTPTEGAQAKRMEKSIRKLESQSSTDYLSLLRQARLEP